MYGDRGGQSHSYTRSAIQTDAPIPLPLEEAVARWSDTKLRRLYTDMTDGGWEKSAEVIHAEIERRGMDEDANNALQVVEGVD